MGKAIWRKRLSRKLELTPRKVPRQSRAKATVDAILEATRRLLLTKGYPLVTTNHVADLAGTSIGTLYQYFPSIDSICTQLYQGLKEDVSTALGVTVANGAKEPIENTLKTLVESFVEAYSREAKLNQLLCELAPDIGAMRKVKEIDAQSIAMLVDYLGSQSIEGSDTLGFVLFCTLDSVCHDALSRDLEHLQAPVFKESLERMVLALFSSR